MNTDQSTSNGSDKAHTYLADWLGDIVALESHVEEAMDRQLTFKPDDPQVAAAFKEFHDAVRDSKQRAQEYQKSYGSTAGNPVVEVGSNLLGKAAGVIDKLRKDEASKGLRDDYTAFNHVAISYSMLHTTALALGDAATADFAHQGMHTYASLAQQVNDVIPEAIIMDLKNHGDLPPISAAAADQSRAMIDHVWKATS